MSGQPFDLAPDGGGKFITLVRHVYSLAVPAPTTNEIEDDCPAANVLQPRKF